MYPWTDRSGRFSLLRTLVFGGLFLPALWLIWRWRSGDLGPLPIHEVILVSGLWAVRLLLISLAVTPLQRLFGWNRLTLVRRQIGVAALAYALLHFSLFILDQKLDLVRVASEIAATPAPDEPQGGQEQSAKHCGSEKRESAATVGPGIQGRESTKCCRTSI